MILIGFLMVNFILVLSAMLAGDVGTIYNLDSILINIGALFVSILVIFIGRFKLFFAGLKEILSLFKKSCNKSIEIARTFTGLSILTLGIGILSTLQGIYSGLLLSNNIRIEQVFLYASFTTTYSLDIVILVFVPIIYKNK